MSNPLPRRAFIKSAAAASSLLLVQPRIAFGAQANETLRLGLIGSGGRGPWIANFFEQHTNSKCVAVHDYFKDQVDAAGNRLNVPEDRRYIGLDGYKELLASDIDAVAIMSPAYFHPEQAVAALEAGKHVYLAKPMAVDVPGCQAIVDAANAHPELTTLIDYQTRKNPQYQKAVQMVHDGAIGAPVCGQAYYHTRRLNIRTKPGDPTAPLRNWFFHIPLSGDIIVEQNIHTIDVANWILDARPLAATGTGGRRVRTDVGDAWDHFIVTYTYPKNVLIDFSSTQFVTGFDDICTRIFGADGTIDAHYFGDVSVTAKSKTMPPENTGNIYADGAITNVKEFVASIVDNKPINNTEASADSTMACILGRTAAYTGTTVTWEEMTGKGERLDP
ncbi:MAG: Gfo/Idh/MocA family oxidoreductase, partial [Candidatus Hydrogenedentales bacterium]